MALRDVNVRRDVRESLSDLTKRFSKATTLDQHGYDQLDLIAEGGYGRVFQGWDRKNRRHVALKVMDDSSKGLNQATIREVGLLKSAGNHENIVTVLDTCFVPDATVLVLEFYPYDLSTFIKEQRKNEVDLLNDKTIKSIMRGILTGTDHLHRRGISHRDLKPRNILLSDKNVPKIADFGLSKFITFPVRPNQENYGTRWYRAPEVLLSCKVTTMRVDMWSIGTIFVEMKEKQALFPGRDHDHQIHLIFEAMGTPTEAVWPHVTENSTFKKLKLPFYSCDRLDTRVPHFNREEMKILRMFLVYDPVNRISARDALEFPYFSVL